jgi:hypothetical protein
LQLKLLLSCRQQPASGNALAVHFDSGNPDIHRSSWQQALYVAAGSDPFALVDASVAAAAAIAGGCSFTALVNLSVLLVYS